MEDIEITKENYLGYKKLFNSKIGFIPNDKKIKKRINTFCIISNLLIFGLGVPITYSLASLTTDLIQGLILIIGSTTTVFSAAITTALGPHKITEKYLKNKYPDLNLDIDTDELYIKLEKYETLAKIPENIDKQKEECISNIQSTDFNNLTPREQIELLEKAKEIIIQSNTKHELTEEKLKQDEVGYQKKLRSMESINK